MVGEVRDGETAELAIHAALTGHLVLSTLHTNSSSGALPRMLDMGVENFLLASTVNVVVAQRLVRKVCEHCKTEYEPPKEVQEDMERVLSGIAKSTVLMNKDVDIVKSLKSVETNKIKFAKGSGCDKCNSTGYKGRLGIFEVLEVTDKVAHLTLDNSPASKIEAVAVEEGMITLLQDGYLRVLEGVTTLEEVMRVAK